jgi:hypothetical protein
VVALPLLEIGQGLGVLASHALLFSQPILAGLIGEETLNRYVTFFENPAALDGLIERIERKAEGDG